MRRGFTLIELLVVIAIIAILAAILFPMLSGVKKSAGRTTCINNMRQIGMAIMGYVDDNQGRYPMDPQSTPPPGVSYSNWDTQAGMATRCVWTFRNYVKNPGIWLCPLGGKRKYKSSIYINPANRTTSDLWGAWGGGYTPEGGFIETNYSAYAFNQHSSTTQHPGYDPLCARGKTPLEFRDECRKWGYNPWLVHDSYTAGTDPSKHWAPHMGGISGCFYDGHVQWIKQQGMKYIN